MCAPVDLRTGEWPHLAFVVNSQMGFAAIYVNGLEVSRQQARFSNGSLLHPPRTGGGMQAGDGVGNAPPQF